MRVRLAAKLFVGNNRLMEDEKFSERSALDSPSHPVTEHTTLPLQGPPAMAADLSPQASRLLSRLQHPDSETFAADLVPLLEDFVFSTKGTQLLSSIWSNFRRQCRTIPATSTAITHPPIFRSRSPVFINYASAFGVVGSAFV